MPSTKILNRALCERNPESFGRYQLLGRIASGGMAEIYVARCGEVEGLQTLQAVKRILPVYAMDETFVRLFQREARILLSLQHANIARVFEVGRVDDHWFLAMELVQGETLAQVNRALQVRGQAWDPDLVAHIGAEVSQALHHAHTQKDSAGRPLDIVHRDISPQNIMLGFDGSVKVIDFGIARWEAPLEESRTSGIRGKMQYVSPEQAGGRRLDGRSDEFSLGAVLYELLDGSRLFYRGTTTATLEAVRDSATPPLPQLNPAMNRALLRALEKDPAKRFATAAAFAQALVRATNESDAVGAEHLSALVSSLFPERLRRWRQIQDMAAVGVGFAEEYVPITSDHPVAPESFLDETLWEGGGPPASMTGELYSPEASLSRVGAEGEYVATASVPTTKTATLATPRPSHLRLAGAAAVLLLVGLTGGLVVGPRTLADPEDITPVDVRPYAPSVGPPHLPLVPDPAWESMPIPSVRPIKARRISARGRVGTKPPVTSFSAPASAPRRR